MALLIQGTNLAVQHFEKKTINKGQNQQDFMVTVLNECTVQISQRCIWIDPKMYIVQCISNKLDFMITILLYEFHIDRMNGSEVMANNISANQVAAA